MCSPSMPRVTESEIVSESPRARPPHSGICLHLLLLTVLNSIIEFHSPVQHTGTDSYFTHKYYSAPPPRRSCFAGQFSICFHSTCRPEQTSKSSLLNMCCSLSSSHLQTGLNRRRFDRYVAFGSLYVTAEGLQPPLCHSAGAHDSPPEFTAARCKTSQPDLFTGKR